MNEYRTFSKINQPVLMLGFEPLHLGGLALVLVVVILTLTFTMPIMFSGIFGFVFVLIVLKIGKTLKEQNQLKNPDYFSGVIAFKKTPEIIEDASCVCNMLLKNGKRD